MSELAQQEGYIKALDLDRETKQQLKRKRLMNHKELQQDLDAVWLGLESQATEIRRLSAELATLKAEIKTFKDLVSINNSRLTRLSRIHPKRETVY